MQLFELVDTSRLVAGRGRRREKIETLASALGRLEEAEIATAVSLLAGRLPGGRVGIGYAAVRAALAQAPVDGPELRIREVDETLGRLAETSGPGSNRRRLELLGALFSRATAEEQSFLARLLLGELRQGALEGVMLEAVALAAGVPSSRLRRAAMLAGDWIAVAGELLTHGPAALDAYRVTLFRPIQPMLAQPVEGWSEAFTRHPRLALEYKIDGARIQVHRRGQEVRIYSRTLREVTQAVPEVVEAVLSLGAGELILDGEAVAVRADGSPQPFQVTMRRFGRRREDEAVRQQLPLRAFFFDCLLAGGESLVDRPGEERWAILESSVPSALRVPRLVAEGADEAEAFLRQALAAGHEGLMAKAPSATYEAGGRGQSWLKIKPTHTLDLVVLAAEWGHGRRRGKLSNLHLGARGEAPGDFVMLGKTFKGLTDRMLLWQTERLLELEVSRSGHVVHVRPELVVEVAFNDVQKSPHYAGGLALRFARVKAHRSDKTAREADTFEAVRVIFERGHRPSDLSR